MSVPIAPFRESNPKAWFSQLEATFALRGISSELTKFHHVVAVLPPHIIDEVDDLIDPPEGPSYTVLKTEIIKRVGLTDRQRVNQVLTQTTLGDRRPSQLLREMQRVIGDGGKNETFLREMWLQRLPREAQAILSTTNNLPLKTAADQADQILEALGPRLHHVEERPSTSQDSLTARVDDLARTVQNLNLSSRNRDRRSSSPRYRNRPRSPRFNIPNDRDAEQRASGFCYYHYEYGARAKNCRPPCKFPKRQGNA